MRVQQAAKKWDFAGDCKNKATYAVLFCFFYVFFLELYRDCWLINCVRLLYLCLGCKTNGDKK